MTEMRDDNNSPPLEYISCLCNLNTLQQLCILTENHASEKIQQGLQASAGNHHSSGRVWPAPALCNPNFASFRP